MESPLDLQSLGASEKDALILEQYKMLQEQGVCIAMLTKEIEDLKNKIAKNSRNSSKPPSSDGYDKPQPKSQRKETGRSSGGQPGHKGRTLKQVEHPDKIEDHKIDWCARCGTNLSKQTAMDYEARQVFDLPKIDVIVTEHRAQIKVCPCCEEQVKAEFPKDVTQAVQYGMRVQATTAYLSQYQLLPYKRCKRQINHVLLIKS